MGKRSYSGVSGADERFVKKLRKNKGLKVVLPNNQMSRADPIPHVKMSEYDRRTGVKHLRVIGFKAVGSVPP
jgi:hypothetical protein